MKVGDIVFGEDYELYKVIAVSVDGKTVYLHPARNDIVKKCNVKAAKIEEVKPQGPQGQ